MKDRYTNEMLGEVVGKSLEQVREDVPLSQRDRTQVFDVEAVLLAAKKRMEARIPLTKLQKSVVEHYAKKAEEGEK